MIEYLRTGKTAERELQRREEWDVRETTTQTPRSVKKERRGRRCAGAEIPLQPVVRWQAVPLQPMER